MAAVERVGDRVRDPAGEFRDDPGRDEQADDDRQVAPGSAAGRLRLRQSNRHEHSVAAMAAGLRRLARTQAPERAGGLPTLKRRATSPAGPERFWMRTDQTP